MLRIRLSRIGKKNYPIYRIVIAEHTKPIQGKFIEIIGNYNPLTKQITIKKDLLTEWLNKGAIPTNTVSKLLKKEKIEHKLIKIHIFKKKAKKTKEEKNEKNEAPKPELTEEKTPNSKKTEEKVEK